MKPLLPLLTLALLQGGCMQLAETDASRDSRYATVIGREFVLKEEFLARGIKADPREPALKYILLMRPPGIAGRAVVDLGRVPAGSRFRIVGVVDRRAAFVADTVYVVEFSGRSFAAPVRLTSVTPQQLYVPAARPDGIPSLNGLYFQATP